MIIIDLQEIAAGAAQGVGLALVGIVLMVAFMSALLALGNAWSWLERQDRNPNSGRRDV